MNVIAAPEKKSAYAYCQSTREYMGEIDIFFAPLEQVYFLPAYVVEFAPGDALGIYKRHRLTASLEAWEIVDDYRYVMLWDTATARPVPNALALGDALPVGCTVLAPPTGLHVCGKWNDTLHAWDVLPDFRGFQYWTVDGALHGITEIGIEPPVGYLTKAPSIPTAEPSDLTTSA